MAETYSYFSDNSYCRIVNGMAWLLAIWFTFSVRMD